MATTHKMTFDFSESFTNDLLVELGAKVMRACAVLPADKVDPDTKKVREAGDKLEVFVKLPSGQHAGGGMTGGVKTPTQAAEFMRKLFAPHGIIVQTNILPDKIQAEYERQEAQAKNEPLVIPEETKEEE